MLASFEQAFMESGFLSSVEGRGLDVEGRGFKVEVEGLKSRSRV